MYKSPIELTQEAFRLKIENEILSAVHKIGVNVDKEELVKALQYDRQQYDKGYITGQAEAVKKFAEKLKAHYPHTPSVCVTIDKVAGEMIKGDGGDEI